jgi:hypothetical protein
MAQLYLPVKHTEADLVLAGQIAEWVDSAELYVAWTPEHGGSVPEIVAELRASATHWPGPLGLLAHVVREIWSVLQGREAGRTPLALPPGGVRATEQKPAAGEAAA